MGPEVAPFHGFTIYRGVSFAAEVRRHGFGNIDKGLFVSPPMSEMSVDNLLSMTIQIERENLAADVWQEFSGRQPEQHSLDFTATQSDRWRAILDRAPTVGSRPTLLVPFEPLGEEISYWIYATDRGLLRCPRSA